MDDRGGHAGIFGAEGAHLDSSDLHDSKDYVVKVFKRGFSLRSLEAQWPPGMLRKSMRSSSGHFMTNRSIPINCALMLKDDRFGFLMWRYWGDLQKLIDLRMRHKKFAAPPFQEAPFQDVYSYVMTCYEILTGRIPIESKCLTEVEEMFLGGQTPELLDCTDPRVKAVIAACWHPDP